jgi:mannose-6-phosphate isomerase class I
MGHNAKDRAELNEMIANDRFADLIREIPVHPGDFIQMNPGTVHAIKGGICLLEIQQSSDITYRLYDYRRTDADGNPRPLHLKQAIDVIAYPAPLTDAVNSLSDRPALSGTPQELIRCDYYIVWELSVAGQATINQDYPFLIVCLIAGTGMIDGQQIEEGDHFILPYGYGEACLNGDMRVILAAAP